MSVLVVLHLILLDFYGVCVLMLAGYIGVAVVSVTCPGRSGVGTKLSSSKFNEMVPK